RRRPRRPGEGAAKPEGNHLLPEQRRHRPAVRRRRRLRPQEGARAENRHRAARRLVLRRRAPVVRADPAPGIARVILRYAQCPSSHTRGVAMQPEELLEDEVDFEDADYADGEDWD